MPREKNKKRDYIDPSKESTNKIFGKIAEEPFIKVDTLFVGGGPATMCTIANYIKNGKITELIGSNEVNKDGEVVNKNSF